MNPSAMALDAMPKMSFKTSSFAQEDEGQRSARTGDSSKQPMLVINASTSQSAVAGQLPSPQQTTIPSPASSTSKPSLYLSLEAPSSSGPSSSSMASSLTTSPNPNVWQQPYSELSRLPSASYRSRTLPHGLQHHRDSLRQSPSTNYAQHQNHVPTNREWSTASDAGSQGVMTPLPSPLLEARQHDYLDDQQQRSRTLSDAASDTSLSSVAAGAANSNAFAAAAAASAAFSPPYHPHSYSNSLSRSTSSASASAIPGNPSAGGQPLFKPTRSRTSAFFSAADSAFSPPPPPRIASIESSPSSTSKDEHVDQSSSAHKGKEREFRARSPLMASAPAQTVQTPPAGLPIPSLVWEQDGPVQSAASLSPMSNLPSAVKAEGSSGADIGAPLSTEPPTAASIAAATLSSSGLPDTPLSTLFERRSATAQQARTAADDRAALKLATRILEQNSITNDSPLPSPTESQSSRWDREPPARLPTLLPTTSTTEPSVASLATPISLDPTRTSYGKGVAPAPKLGLREAAAATTSGGTESNKAVSAPSSAATAAEEYFPGHVLNGSYEIVRTLGKGAFSQVVLAKKVCEKDPQTPQAPSKVTGDPFFASPPQHIRKHSSGTARVVAAGKGHGKSRSLAFDAAAADSAAGSHGGEVEKDLVAIKLISRSHIKKNDRMKISILREVEVLKHIRHPSLVHLTSSFETPFHTCLVLEYSSGGELFDFLADHHRQISEALARRIFGELADVLGWMHSIGLVHRDIKLENILLTSRPFNDRRTLYSQPPDPSSLPILPTPFVKLTDFGLSRFIDPASPHLETRCGSEEYAAPELIMGKRYDGRQTDAWALGVVLYAIITGSLPFLEEHPQPPPGTSDAKVTARTTATAAATLGVEPQASTDATSTRGSGKPHASRSTNGRTRRSYLLRIVKAEYAWPSASSSSFAAGAEPEQALVSQEDGQEAARLVSEPVKTLVGALLTRDAKRRARVEDVWDFEWMIGPGAPEKRSIRGGDLEGVSLSAFGIDDVEVVRAEVPEDH